MGRPPKYENWNQARILYLSGGVTLLEVSKLTGIPLDALKQRSSREDWCLRTPQAKHAASKSATLQVVQSLHDVIAEHGKQSRLHLSSAVHKNSKTLNSKSPEELLNHCPQIESTVKAAAKIHGWGSDSDELRPSVVNIAFLNTPASQLPSKEPREISVDAKQLPPP